MTITYRAHGPVRFTLTSLGAGDVDLSDGTFAVDGKVNKTLDNSHDQLTFTARIDGPGAEWEEFAGVYDHGTTTLPRTTILASSASDAKVTFSGAVTVTLNLSSTAWNEMADAVTALETKWYNVVDYGATGDGTTDDTAAFQAAIDAINNSGRAGRLLVPAPDVSYRIFSITISPEVDITIVGERSRLRRVDDATQQPFYAFEKGRMFNISGQSTDPIDPWGRNARVTFEGIIFDGNRDNQLLTDNVTEWSSLRDFSLQWFHGVSVEADDTQPWRQPVWFRDCDFEMQPGEGISLYKNASVRAERCRFWNCFRGGITVVGGYIELIARDCISDDDLVTTIGMNSGLYFEYEPEGYVRTNIVNVDGWVFHQGVVNVVTHGDALQVSGQTVAPLLPDEKNDYVLRGLRVMQENKAEQIKFYNSGEANFLISDSIFYGGRQDSSGTLNRRTMIDGRNIEVNNCVFVASNNGRPVGDAAPEFYCAVVVRDFNENTHGRQRHRFSNCRFVLDETCHASAPVYGIYTDYIGHSIRASTPWAAGLQPAFIVFEGCSFQQLKYYPGRDKDATPFVRKFDQFLEPTLGTMMKFDECDGHAINGFKIEQGQASYPGNFTFVGGIYTVEGWLFRLGMPVGQPAESLSLTFRDFLVDDRFNHISNTEAGTTFWNDIEIAGHRTVMVVSDPTAAGPVSVTSRLLCDVVREDNIYNIRLEGTPVVASSLTITNVQSTDAIEDNGTGDLVDAADGITVVGSIDYSTGVIGFSWPAGKEPGDTEHVIHSYQHSNSVPGFEGDIAILKTDRSQQWMCTTGHPTAATWTSEAAQTESVVRPTDYGALGDGSGTYTRQWLVGGTHNQGYADWTEVAAAGYTFITQDSDLDAWTIDAAGIQRAINVLVAAGGGVLDFPNEAGQSVYVVRLVQLRPGATGIIYRGNGCRILKTPENGESQATLKFWRMFTTSTYAAEFLGNQNPILLQDFVFDGNQANMNWAPGSYDQEQACSIFLEADNGTTEQVYVHIERCRFVEGVAEGVGIYRNVNVAINDCLFENTFRGGFTITGGHVTANISRCEFDENGFDIEVDGAGNHPTLGSTSRIDFSMRDCKVVGDLDISVKDGSTCVLSNVQMGLEIGGFAFSIVDSSLVATECRFVAGVNDHILRPTNSRFVNCEFVGPHPAVITDPEVRQYCLQVRWVVSGTVTNQTLNLIGCEFGLNPSYDDTFEMGAVHVLTASPPADNNLLTVRGCRIGWDTTIGVFDAGVSTYLGGLVDLDHTFINAVTAVSAGHSSTSSWFIDLRASRLLLGPNVTTTIAYGNMYTGDKTRLDYTIDETQNLLSIGTKVGEAESLGRRVILSSVAPASATNKGGFLGDLWRLKAPPTSGDYEWVCTSSHGTAATWTLLTTLP